MNIDPSGEFFISLLIMGIVAGALVGGAINGVNAYNSGQRGLGLFGAIAGGAIMGGAMGGLLVLGGAASLGLVSAWTGIGIAAGVGLVAGFASYTVENTLRTDREWTIQGFLNAGEKAMFKGLSTYGIGFVAGKMGAFDKMILNPALKGVSTLSKRITYNLTKAIFSAINPSIGRTFMTKVALKLGESLTKILFVSSFASGVRWLIDKFHK